MYQLEMLYNHATHCISHALQCYENVTNSCSQGKIMNLISKRLGTAAIIEEFVLKRLVEFVISKHFSFHEASTQA